MSTFLSMAIEQFLLPVMQIYFCFAVSAALWGNPGIEQAAGLFSRCLGWLLKACGALFSFVLGLQGLLAGNSDSAGLRATGQRQCGQICRLFADVAGLCASVLTLYFFMVFLSTLLLLITGSGG